MLQTDESGTVVTPKVQVAIGPNEPTTYHLMLTTAPEAYDHGCTIHLGELDHDNLRVILVRDRDVGWSQGRYGSGMYALRPAEDWMVEHAEEVLYKRLTGKED